VLCSCCSRIWKNGKRGEEQSAYWWTVRRADGTTYDVGLCVKCCAIWRQNAEHDPALLPARIRNMA
jgi:hypothetical protein